MTINEQIKKRAGDFYPAVSADAERRADEDELGHYSWGQHLEMALRGTARRVKRAEELSLFTQAVFDEYNSSGHLSTKTCLKGAALMDVDS